MKTLQGNCLPEWLQTKLEMGSKQMQSHFRIRLHLLLPISKYYYQVIILTEV